MASVLTKKQRTPRASADGSADGPADGPTDPAHLPEPLAKDLVQLFKLLADETRLRILYFLLHHQELNVRTLCSLLGQSQPAVSHHLALLRVAGLIRCRRDGKHNYYRVLPQRFEQLLGEVLKVAPAGAGGQLEGYLGRLPQGADDR